MSQSANQQEIVRSLLSQWASGKSAAQASEFMKKVAIGQIVEKPAYIIRLDTLYDVRSAAKEILMPYNESNPPQVCADLWACPSGLKDDFSWQQGKILYALAPEPLECSSCEGRSRKECPSCRGSKAMSCPACSKDGKSGCNECSGAGKLKCIQCGGEGRVQSAAAGAGFAQMRGCQACSGSGYQICSSCMSGPKACKTCDSKREVPCAVCTGEGEIVCQNCRGERMVVRAGSADVHYSPILQKILAPDADSPLGLFPQELPSNFSGDPIFDFDGKSVEFGESAPSGHWRGAAAELLRKAQAGLGEFDGKSARIIKQKMRVERVPAYSTTYIYGGKTYACWATPMGNKVVSLRDPFSEQSETWLKEAQSCLKRGERAAAAELVRQSWELNSSTAAAMLLEQLKAPVKKQQSFPLVFHGAGALLATLAAGIFYRAHYNVLWPLLAYGVAVFLCSIAIQSLPGLPGNALVKKAAILGVSITAMSVLMTSLNPIGKLDAIEFNRTLQVRFGSGAIPDRLTPEDQAYLSFMIDRYGSAGVNVSAAQDALEANASRIEGERAEAMRLENERKLRQHQLLAIQESSRKTPALRRASLTIKKPAVKKKAGKR